MGKIHFSNFVINLFQVFKNDLHQMEIKYLYFEYDGDTCTLLPTNKIIILFVENIIIF